MGKTEIRESSTHDIAGLKALYSDAFPDEELLPVVIDLLQDAASVLSLVSVRGTILVGHVIFTPCRLADGTDGFSLLGPLAVATAWQRQGIGRALVGSGLQRLGTKRVSEVFVLGDPSYYGRLGFVPETDVSPPYPLPPEWRGAWQSIRLHSSGPSSRGQLSVPRPWLNPALWAP